MQIIQKRRIFFVISSILVLASIIFIANWGLKLGIDFRGGVLIEASFQGDIPNSDEITQSLEGFNLGSLTVQPSGDNMFIVRFVSDDDRINEQVQDKLLGLRENENVKIERVEFISSTISGELKKKAITAVTLAVIGIALYVAWAFRKVSYPVESWKYGLAAVIALTHDVIITVGVFAFLGHQFGVEVNVAFVAALLTILGYSVNDTIVIFDRIRENLNKAEAKKNFEDTVNNSINESLARSINTSLTVIVVLLAIIFYGGATIQTFAIAMLIGIFFGTYSSIFVASALLVEFWKFRK